MKTQFQVPELTFFKGLVPGSKAKHELLARNADVNFREAVQHHQRAESTRKEKIGAIRKTQQTKIDALRKEIDALEAEYQKGDPHGIVAYYSLILQRVSYPDGFPQQCRIAFVSESRQLVVEYQLPSPEIVPSVAEYKYVKTKDAIEEKRPTLPTLRISIVTLWQPSP